MITAKYYGLTDMGMVRTNNEDTYHVSNVWDDRHVLAMAIDGVGGYEGGEVAARIARDTIADFYKTPEAKTATLKDAVVAANNKIYQSRQETTQYNQMSCVLTAVLIDLDENKVSMAHVGDTRLYQFYDGNISKLSHDHSLVGYREEIGELTEQEAMAHPNRNIVSKVVGMELISADSDYVECHEFPIVPNSTLLLCSDGLCDMITSSIMTEELSADTSLKKKAEGLIKRANDAGGKDNVTVVLVQLDDNAENHIVIEPAEETEVQTNDEPASTETEGEESKENNRKLWSFFTGKWAKLFLLIVLSSLISFLCGYLIRH